MQTEAFAAILALAAATPAVALLGWRAHRRACEAAGAEPAARTRRNLIVLAAAGPANLLLWAALNAGGERRELSDAAGIALAVVVFLLASIATGSAGRYLGRLRGIFSRNKPQP